MQGSLDISNANFDSVSMPGSMGDIENLMCTTSKTGTKVGADKPPVDPQEDWLEAAPFLVADNFCPSGTSGLFPSKFRSGSLDGLLLSKEGFERANSQLKDMVGSLDLADVLGGSAQPPAPAPAPDERTFSKELAALDLPSSLGGRQQSGASAVAMSISGSTEGNVSLFLQSVENQTLPNAANANNNNTNASKANTIDNSNTDTNTSDGDNDVSKASVQSLLSREADTPAPPPASRVAVFAQPAPVAAAHLQFAAVPGQQLPQPVANRPAHRPPQPPRPAPDCSEEARAAAATPTAHLAEGSGSHVKHRPEMQRRARMGQEHWLNEVRAMRGRWDEREECRNNEAYAWQVDTCASLQIKSQHECILRALHLAAADKLITPLPFSQDTDNSFLGWTGFQVEQERAQEFRRRIEALFPVPLPENTLHTAFRRAGLVPDKWTSGWLGMSPFRFSLQTRQHYR